MTVSQRPLERVARFAPAVLAVLLFIMVGFRIWTISELIRASDRVRAAVLIGRRGQTIEALSQLTGTVHFVNQLSLAVLLIAMMIVATVLWALHTYRCRIAAAEKALRASEARYRHQALYDALTDLPNRNLFADRVSQAIRASAREKSSFSLLYLDLDRFKEINDVLGHQTGDAFLRHVAGRLAAQIREADTIARFGGDEFVLLLPGSDAAGAVLVAGRLLKSLEEPFYLEGRVLYAGCSIGIVTAPAHGSDVTTLLRRADMAMYEAKRLGAGYAIYKDGTDLERSKRLDLVTDLRAAIESRDLLLHYQPKVDLATGLSDRVEALVRWAHPAYGVLLPDEFIGIAEQTGLIKPLTYWVLNEAVRQAGEWRDVGFEPQVAVNLSVSILQDVHLVETVKDTLLRWGAMPESLLLEITESALIADPARALETVTRLHELGVAVSIDDFGTGYSSLTYLQRLPVDEVKIDRELVMHMTGLHSGPAIIVRSIIDLGHNLGLRVVAEGVETEQQFQLLTDLGCDEAQGYHLGVPMPADECAAWTRARKALRIVGDVARPRAAYG